MNTPRFFIFALLCVFATPIFAQTNRNTNRNTNRGGGNSNSSYRQYRSNTMLGDATIQVDSESRAVVVVTDEETHAEMARVIDDLDHPKPQVLIKVVFVEVSLDKNLDVGLEGSYTFKTGRGIPITGSNSITQTLNETFTGGSRTTVTQKTVSTKIPTDGTATVASLFGLATAATPYGAAAALVGDNWSATLHALEERGNLRILSRPSIMARNNQEGVIVVGEEVPFVTNSQITDSGQINNVIQYQDVGIILRVTPFITSDKSVEMIVNPEISSLSGETISVSNNVNAPIIKKRSAETVVVTPNATTVVIGGMMQQQDVNTVQKVPILGDIPVLGFPFRRTVKKAQKTELMIFLTPYIVEGEKHLKELTVNEANRADLTRKSFTPEEIKESLEPLELLPAAESETAPEVKRETKREVKKDFRRAAARPRK